MMIGSVHRQQTATRARRYRRAGLEDRTYGIVERTVGQFGSERASDGETAGGETDTTVVTELVRNRSIASEVTRSGGSAANGRHCRRKGTAFAGELVPSVRRTRPRALRSAESRFQ